MNILYAFSFENKYIFEVKNENETEKLKRYQWFVYDSNLLKLDFQESYEKTRYFKDGTILDMESKCVFYNGVLYDAKEHDKELIKMILYKNFICSVSKKVE